MKSFSKKFDKPVFEILPNGDTILYKVIKSENKFYE